MKKIWLLSASIFMLQACANSATQSEFTNIQVSLLGAENAQCTVTNGEKQYVMMAPGTVLVHNGPNELVFECAKKGYDTTIQRVTPGTPQIPFLQVAEKYFNYNANKAYSYPAQIDVLMRPSSGLAVGEIEAPAGQPLALTPHPSSFAPVEDEMPATEIGVSQGDWMAAPPVKPEAPRKPVENPPLPNNKPGAEPEADMALDAIQTPSLEADSDGLTAPLPTIKTEPLQAGDAVDIPVMDGTVSNGDVMPEGMKAYEQNIEGQIEAIQKTLEDSPSVEVNEPAEILPVPGKQSGEGEEGKGENKSSDGEGLFETPDSVDPDAPPAL